MRTRLRHGLTAALKSRDRAAIAALRSALAAIDNAEAVPDDRPAQQGAGDEHVAGSVVGVGTAEVKPRQLSESDLHAIVAKEAAERSTTADGYARMGRDDAAERLRREAEVLNGYLDPAT